MRDVDCIAFGSCTFDLLLTVERVAGRDERVSASSARAGGGGPAATAGVALRRLGPDVALVSAVGDDVFGGVVRAELDREGIDVSEVQILDDTTSTISSVVIDATGARSMTAFTGCLGRIRLDRIDWQQLPVPRAVMLDGNNPALALAAAHWARGHGVPVLLDGGNIAPANLAPLLPLTDIFIPDIQSARRQLGGQGTPAEMCEAFAAKGPAIVCITLGEEGSVAWEKGELHSAEAAKGIRIVDTTGAGDNFHGAFQFCRLRGWDMARALAFCNAFAALTCRAIGGRSAIPTEAETERAIRGARADASDPAARGS
jgi:sugar/nucleoside kinase (ribokinase family)